MKPRKLYIYMATFVVGIFVHNNVATGANRLLLQDVTMQSGGSAFLSIQMENDDWITGFQCDLYLPQGMSIETSSILLGRTNTSQHGVTSRKMEDGAIRFVCASPTSATFSGNSGDVLICRLKGNLSLGQYEMRLKNIVLTDPNATRYTSENVSATITVLESNNKLELIDITIPNDNTGQALPIIMKNESEISSFQCDLYLPDGVEYVKNGNGDYQIELGRTTTDKHGVAAHLMDNGGLRIVCSSTKGTAFTGNSGRVLSVWIKCNQPIGNYVARLNNIVLTNSDAARFTSSGVSCNVYVEDADAIVVPQSSTLNEVDEIYFVNGQKLSKRQRGINILRMSDGTSKKVLVK